MEDYEEIYQFLIFHRYPTGFSKNQKRVLLSLLSPTGRWLPAIWAEKYGLIEEPLTSASAYGLCAHEMGPPYFGDPQPYNASDMGTPGPYNTSYIGPRDPRNASDSGMLQRFGDPRSAHDTTVTRVSVNNPRA